MVDQQVQRLISARDKSAVNKLELIEFRRRHPDIPILVFEGTDDVIVYNSWIFRIRQELRYEPFPVRGKDQVLKLKVSLDLDLNNASSNVFYFVDRDFDDLRGIPQDSAIFMTDRYSVDNYLTDLSVVEQVLSSELCCAKYPEIRLKLLETYSRIFSIFLQHMVRVNFRIFVARRERIRIEPGIPEKLNTFVSLTIDNVEMNSLPADLHIHLIHEPTNVQSEEAKVEFEKLDKSGRHRGKFQLAFMMKWFQCVDQEWHQPASRIFVGTSRTGGTRVNEVVLGSLAGRSPVPEGLPEFLEHIP